MRYAVLALVVALAACGDDDDDDIIDPDGDGGQVDTDAPPGSDATPGTPDAVPSPDAPPPDAAGPDADPCGTIGMACTSGGDECDDGQRCELSVAGEFCTKLREGCGGFAGATCDDSAAPLCHYLPSADFGVCLSAFERDCICDRSPGSILGCP